MQSFEVIWKLTHILAEKFVNNSIYADNLTKIRLKVMYSFSRSMEFLCSFSLTLIGISICDSLFLNVFEALTQLSITHSIDSIDIQKKDPSVLFSQLLMEFHI